jgi:hypothetical protein
MSELADRILQKIDAWVGPPSTDVWSEEYADHAHDCAANAEGQLCCLDAEHSARPKLRALIEQAMNESTAPEEVNSHLEK